MAEDSGAGIGAAPALGEQEEVELDDCEEEAREEPTIRGGNIPRGPSAEELASHLPSHHRAWLPIVSATNTDSMPRMSVWCLWSVWTADSWP